MGISAPTFKYEDVKPALRARLRRGMERARALARSTLCCWPIVAVMVPAVRTYYRERL